MTKEFAKAFNTIINDVGRLEPGDMVAAVFNDGVIVLAMDKHRHLTTTVVAGEPLVYDTNLNLLEEGE
jgi:hypothetical protein